MALVAELETTWVSAVAMRVHKKQSSRGDTWGKNKRS